MSLSLCLLVVTGYRDTLLVSEGCAAEKKFCDSATGDKVRRRGGHIFGVFQQEGVQRHGRNPQVIIPFFRFSQMRHRVNGLNKSRARPLI